MTVYLNYVDGYSGMLLNPQKFRSSMPSIFGPSDCYTVLTSIFNSCIKCAFQQTRFIEEILKTFSTSNDEEEDSCTQIKCIYKNIFFSKNLIINFIEIFSGKWFNSICITY